MQGIVLGQAKTEQVPFTRIYGATTRRRQQYYNHTSFSHTSESSTEQLNQQCAQLEHGKLEFINTLLSR